MSGLSPWLIIFYMIPTITGIIFCLFLAVVLIKRPSWILFFFLCFYLIGIYHLAGVFISKILMQQEAGSGVQNYWKISLAVSRLRYLFLILFAHSLHRFRSTPILTIFISAIVATGIILPFFVYSLIPSLMELFVILYFFFYCLIVYVSQGRLSVSPRRTGLLRAVLLCSGFFLTGIILDLLEEIPQPGVYISILLVDFYPVYLVCIGAVMTLWAVRDLVKKSDTGVPGHNESLLPTHLSVTRREREIIGLILRGETNAIIAETLFISESTVKKHINNIFRKLDITSRWELLKITGNTPKGVADSQR